MPYRRLCLSAGPGLRKRFLHLHCPELWCRKEGPAEAGLPHRHRHQRSLLPGDLLPSVCFRQAAHGAVYPKGRGRRNQLRYPLPADRGCILSRHWAAVPALRLLPGGEKAGHERSAHGHLPGYPGAAGLCSDRAHRRDRHLDGHPNRLVPGRCDGIRVLLEAES